MARKVEGLFTALITPFAGSGRLDDEALSDLVRFQVKRGIDGLYPCGTTGLGPMLKPEERKTITEVVVKEAAGRATVVVQVGAADTSTTIELAKHAEKTGADAVASLTPYYYKPGERAVVTHFERIAKSVGIPLYAYNIPQFTGNNLAPGLVATLARKGTIAGIKDSSRDFLQLLDVINKVPDGFTVMNGTEEYGLFAIIMGADGLVSGGASAFPEVFKKLVAAEKSGDLDGAVKAQKEVVEFKEAVAAGPIASYYEILRLRGVDCGIPRAPILPLDGPSKAKLKKTAARLIATH